MKNTVLQRIIDFSESRFLSKKKFAEAIGMEQTTVNNQLIGKRGLSIDLVLSVLDTFKDVSAEWLLRGKGEMTKQPTNQEAPVSTNNSDMESAFLKKEAFYLRQMNERLDDLIKANETIENLKEEVESLKKRLELAEQDSNKMAVNVVKHKFA